MIPALSVVFNVLITFSGNGYTNDTVSIFCNFVLLLCVLADVTVPVILCVILASVSFTIAPINLLNCCPLSFSKTMLSPIFNSVLNFVFLPVIDVEAFAMSIEPDNVMLLSSPSDWVDVKTVSAVNVGDPAVPKDFTCANSNAICVGLSGEAATVVPLLVEVPPVTVSPGV